MHPEKLLGTIFWNYSYLFFGKYISFETKNKAIILMDDFITFLHIGKIIWIREAKETIGRRAPERETSKCVYYTYVCLYVCRSIGNSGLTSASTV